MEIEKHDDVCVLRMNTGKANAISADFLERLNAKLDEVLAMRARAVVLTGTGSAFSAGLDLPSLVDLSQKQIESFMVHFDATMLRVFELPLPVIAAINGHAIAGGCVLGLQADHRFAADTDLRIGLNEVANGLGLPTVVVETLRFAVPSQSLGAIALEGRVVDPHAACALGLVDEVVPQRALLEHAIDKARVLARAPGRAYAVIKQALRAPVVERVRADHPSDAARWAEVWCNPETQRAVRELVDRIKKKRS
jgi:enoyl-CoA hydratase